MIRKFRTVEEMNAASRPQLETDPHRILELADGLYELAARFCGTRRRFRGVHKFRTLEESNQFRLTWLRERWRAAAESKTP